MMGNYYTLSVYDWEYNGDLTKVYELESEFKLYSFDEDNRQKNIVTLPSTRATDQDGHQLNGSVNSEKPGQLSIQIGKSPQFYILYLC